MAENLNFDIEYEVQNYPSKTFRIVQYGTERRINGMIDGVDAVMQSIDTILNVERYKWAIYSWQYGNEFKDCIGHNVNYVQSELTRMVTDALSVDDRILSIEDFKFTYPDKTSVRVEFKVNTIYGQSTGGVTV